MLTYMHTATMFLHMRTPLILPDHLMRELKRRAARRGETLSAVVAEVVRRGLEAVEQNATGLVALPRHRLGRPKVNLADRDAIERVMEGR